MPFEAMLVSTIIVGVFVVFGAVLYRADRRTRDISSAANGTQAKRRSF